MSVWLGSGLEMNNGQVRIDEDCGLNTPPVRTDLTCLV